MIKKILSLILLNIFIISFVACGTEEVSITYYQEGQESRIRNLLPANIEIAKLTGSNVTVIPSEELMEDKNIGASSSLLINRTDNETVYAEDIYHRMYPASLTKLITSLVVFEQGDLEDTVTISHNASNITYAGAKLAGFKEGDKIDLESLLNIFLIYSANDAGVAIAEHISDTEEAFAMEMNETAIRLGAVHSNFVNSHGLHHEEHYTTAYDMYLIFNELLYYDEFVNIINKVSFTANYVGEDGTEYSNQFMNTNRYLRGQASGPDDITVIGGKTGTTNEAGSCLVLLSVDENDKEYISIILQARGGDSLYSQMTYLLKMIE